MLFRKGFSTIDKMGKLTYELNIVKIPILTSFLKQNFVEDFRKVPVENSRNQRPDRNPWDDSGWERVLVVECGEPLVPVSETTGVICRPVYQGVNLETGKYDPATAWPGALKSPEVFLRETVAMAVSMVDKHMHKHYGLRAVVAEGWRPPDVGVAGHTKAAIGHLKGNESPSVEDLARAGISASAFFTSPDAQADNLHTEAFRGHLENTPVVKDTIEGISRETGKSVADVLDQLMRTCAAFERARAKKLVSAVPITPLGIEVPFDVDRTTHPSGGSVDLFVMQDGVIVNPVYYDFFGPLGRVDALEKFPCLVRAYLADPKLRDHFNARSILGLLSGSIRNNLRVLYHIVDAVGGTHCGEENWHKNFGNIVYDPETGKVVIEGPGSKKYRRAGNVLQSVQTMTNPVAIYGGTFACRQMEREYGDLL